MPTPFVTILIDTYNHAGFIAEAIESVLQQDFPSDSMEILVVDDGSTDGTAEGARKFAPRVRLISKANGGQASAFNTGIPEARGEIVAFLDGDDWWAAGKLRKVIAAFGDDAHIGLVGHGFTEMHLDGGQRTEVARERTQFRVTSAETARQFRMLRGFLGTSRMAYRRELLEQIGSVPEALRFEADEYLFTVGALLGDVVILPESLTFYRLHDKNLFQFTSGDISAVRAKHKVLAALAAALEQTMWQRGVAEDVARVILECVEVEADHLRLVADSGWPWETVATELKIMQVFHRDASLQQHLFSYLRMVPAGFLPARTYYEWRRRLSTLSFYKNFRRKVLPFPVPGHVERRDKAGP
jgi:glycosyltransferase involved in cell wall biosynthesis